MRSRSREVRLVAKKNWGEIVRNNIVTIMFVVLCAVCITLSSSIFLNSSFCSSYSFSMVTVFEVVCSKLHIVLSIFNLV